ncbi:MAG TPA: hypothetical protein VJO32_10445 [Ktedonobacteraceae bacterium]|nr:hypothetical protein [Ktedonobacteraceae bacterium]
MTDYATFRQHLDAVLRTLDVKQVSAFLIAENQWDEGTPDDPEYAMWMMIAGSQTLRDLHEQARRWLVSHGHEEEANAVLHRDTGKGAGGDNKNRQHHQKGKRG